jgi:drug/metabolite transporter (DMT)-like permease
MNFNYILLYDEKYNLDLLYDYYLINNYQSTHKSAQGCSDRRPLARYNCRMSLFALTLLLTAAALHAVWNLLLKQVENKYIITWWSTLLSTVTVLPLLAMGRMPDRQVWPYIIASAIVEVAYMATLASAYDLSDFSLVYPVARGAAPAFLAIWSAIFLGDRLSRAGLVGLVMIIAGLGIVGSNEWLAHRNHTHVQRRGLFLALGVALLISTYSTIDGAAVKQTDPTAYSMVMLGLTGVFFTPFALQRNGWREVARTGQKHWLRILLIGAFGLLAYALVLNAYAIAKVSYAGAIREVSIVFAALAGWKLLGERLGGVRLAGSIIIFGGILLIALAP